MSPKVVISIAAKAISESKTAKDNIVADKKRTRLDILCCSFGLTKNAKKGIFIAGADIEEIMRECDIPRAEADMLLAVHRQKLTP